MNTENYIDGCLMDTHIPSELVLAECVDGKNCGEESFYEALCVFDEAGYEKLADYAYKVN